MNDDPTPKAKSRGVALRFDGAPLKLAGWAAHEKAERAQDEIFVRLMWGDLMLGRLRRDRERPDVDAHMGYGQPPCGFNVPDYGLRAFADLSGVQDLAVVVESEGAGLVRHALADMHRGEIAVAPLGSRTGVRESLRLGDVWLGSTRDLSLRFEGAGQVARSIDAYQCTLTGERMLVKVASDQPIGGLVSIATMKLINPYLPVLLIFKGEDGAIDAIDLIPFPSLVRGGLHAGERLILGDGSDDLRDTATVSTQLLRALLLRDDSLDRHVAAISLDETIHTGLEPMLDPDLLAWVSTFLKVGVAMSEPREGAAPDFIRDVLSRFSPNQARSGHVLHLPADSIPTLSALIQPLPGGLASQKVAGAMVVADGDRLGRIFSVWQPPLGEWLDGMQPNSTHRTAPILEVVASGAADAEGQLAMSWPLSIALRKTPTRVVRESPFELSSELPVPLLRSGAGLDPVQLSVIIHCQRDNQPVTPLLESLVRQEGVAGFDVILVTPPGKLHSDVAHFLNSRLEDRHAVVRQPFGRGKLEQIAAVRDRITHDHVLIVDGDSILPDPRTLATLLPMLDGPNVETVGCLVRRGQGKSATQSAGYSPAGVNLSAIPSLSFGAVDPAAFRQPATFPVIANSMAVLVTRRSTIDRLDPRGSTALRPEVDDLMLGIQVIERGGLNLSSSIVSAFSTHSHGGRTDIGISVPYRLSPETLARLTLSTTIVQSFQ